MRLFYYQTRSLIILSLLLFVIPSCKKEVLLDVHANKISVNDNVNVQCLTFTTTHRFACGGIKGERGSIYRTIGSDITSWQKVYTSPGNCLYCIAFVNDTLGFACGENLLLLKTIDGGTTWADQHSIQGQPPANYAGTLRSIYCADADHIYVAGGKDYEVGITYKTYNGGGFWIYNTFDNELRSVCFKDKHSGYFSGYGTIIGTNDSAETFTPLQIGNDFFTSLSFINSDLGYACGYNGGIYITSNGGNSWNEQLKNNNDLNHTRHFNRISFLNSSIGYVAGNNGLVMITSDGGESWKGIKKFTDGNLFSIFIKDANHIYITAQEGEIYELNP